ncbi:MAG: hypothetical protein KF708_03065 [Pirellulales bacterium]|nr:hypothetical protein [Pirellulales bacterium]
MLAADHLLALVAALTLVSVSIALVAWHVRSWRLIRAELPRGAERDYRWRQFRRRMQASSLVGVLGVAIYLGYLIPYQTMPRFFLAFWLMVIACVLWLSALAWIDVLATRTFFATRRHAIDIERAAWQAEVERSERARQNGSSV